jgi:hypothetical protein
VKSFASATTASDFATRLRQTSQNTLCGSADLGFTVMEHLARAHDRRCGGAQFAQDQMP